MQKSCKSLVLREHERQVCAPPFSEELDRITANLTIALKPLKGGLMKLVLEPISFLDQETEEESRADGVSYQAVG